MCRSNQWYQHHGDELQRGYVGDGVKNVGGYGGGGTLWSNCLHHHHHGREEHNQGWSLLFKSRLLSTSMNRNYKGCSVYTNVKHTSTTNSNNNRNDNLRVRLVKAFKRKADAVMDALNYAGGRSQPWVGIHVLARWLADKQVHAEYVKTLTMAARLSPLSRFRRNFGGGGLFEDRGGEAGGIESEGLMTMMITHIFELF